MHTLVVWTQRLNIFRFKYDVIGQQPNAPNQIIVYIISFFFPFLTFLTLLVIKPAYSIGLTETSIQGLQTDLVPHH